MKRLLTTVTLILTLFGTTGIAMAAETPYGSASALADESLTLNEMLTYAIQDEYAAKAEYLEILNTYGQVKPFSSIIKAETKHISSLIPLFETNGIAIPINDADSHVVLPGSLNESYVVGVEAEIKNIAMYDSFLEEDLPSDVRTVFESLKAASESHLAAFQRKVNR